jgi:glutathione S-transferase
MTGQLVLAGQYGSPYTLKMRAVLRYRRIPFRWVLRDSRWDNLPDPPARIIPVIVFPGQAGAHGDVTVDSSPQILRLKREYRGRSVVPTDPALAFVDALIEDFADEWLTKAMYHYRWAYDADIAKAGKLLPLSQNLQLDSDRARQMYDFSTQRQIGRRPLVGSTDWNAPTIQGSYRRVLEILQAQLSTRDFVLGDRPGRSDFALFGQLSQLVRWDPTSMSVAVELAPKVVNWVERLDDLSWLEVDTDHWRAADDLDPATNDLLREIGRTYAPFMVANAEALAVGADEVV